MGNAFFQSETQDLQIHVPMEDMAYLSQGQRDSSLFHVETLRSHGRALLLEYVSTA